MRVLCSLLVAVALLCVVAAQPSAAPVTLSFSYEQAGHQSAPAHEEEATLPQHSMTTADTEASSPRSHLAPPIVTTHPLSQSHTHQLAINDTLVRADNSSSGAGVMARNSTTVTKEDRTVVRQDGSRNGTVVEKRVTERREESEKEESEKKDGDKEASFPDDNNPVHNITHGNHTITNRSQYHHSLRQYIPTV